MAGNNRTGTAAWQRLRKQVLADALDAGQLRCPLCGIGLDWEYSKRPNSPEVDHIKPVKQGGTDERANLRVICRLDNQKLGGALTKRPRPVIQTTDLDASPIW